MLEKLVLRNFQPHRKLVVKFDKRVTSIVGPTDVGKSAILRALRWLCLNRCGSKRLISWWAKATSVTLHVDGHVIKRRKGKSNLYELDGQVLKAFGTTVPEPIARLLNVSEENFQRQIDPPLWLASSPAQVGRELNKIVNLDIIDLTLSNMARIKRDAQSKVTSLLEIRSKLKRETADLSWIVECRRDYDRLKDLDQKKSHVQLDIAFLSEILSKVREHKQTTREAKECLQTGRLAVDLGESAQAVEEKATTLKSLLDRISTTSQELHDSRIQLRREQTKLGRIKECPVCGSPMKS